MRRIRLIHLVVILGVAAAVVLVALGRFAKGPPNVILISVDTLRPDHLGCYGYGRATSPNVDRFAADAVVFRNCFAQAPATRPSCGVFLSGSFPHEIKIFSNRDDLPPEVTTVAELLRDRGYLTIGVVSNFVLRRGGGFDQGFDLYDDRMDEAELVRGIPERIADRTTDAAISLLRLHRKRRLFMWIHYQDPHGPYTPPGPFKSMFVDTDLPAKELPLNETVSGKGGIPSYQRLGQNRDFNYYVAQYDGEIRYFDEHFGRLVEALKQLGLYDKSLIIITADHGEGMGEHDYFFAHGEYVYNSLIHVPLIMRYGKGRGERLDVVEHLDVVPTILGTVGMDPGAYMRGMDVLDHTAGDRAVFSEMPGRYSLMRSGLKLIYHAEDNATLLFDISDDPGEVYNLGDDPELKPKIARIAGDLSVLRSQNLLGQGIRRKTRQITEEEREKLKALGYVQ